MRVFNIVPAVRVRIIYFTVPTVPHGMYMKNVNIELYAIYLIVTSLQTVSYIPANYEICPCKLDDKITEQIVVMVLVTQMDQDFVSLSC